MYTFAQTIVRHKVGAAAVLALIVTITAPRNEAGAEGHDGSHAPAQASMPVAEAGTTEEVGFIDDIMGETEMLIEKAGLVATGDGEADPGEGTQSAL